MRKAALFDLDGVLYNSQEGMLTAAEELLGWRPDIRNWTTFDWIFRLVIERTGKDSDTVADALFGDHVMRNARPTVGSQKLITAIAAKGYEIIVATGRPPKQQHLTLGSLNLHFPEILPCNTHFCPINESHKTGIFKGKVALESGVAFMVEDSPPDIKGAQSLPKFKSRIFMPDKPWNVGSFRGSKNPLRIGNFDVNDLGWSTLLEKLLEHPFIDAK